MMLRKWKESRNEEKSIKFTNHILLQLISITFCRYQSKGPMTDPTRKYETTFRPFLLLRDLLHPPPPQPPSNVVLMG